MRILVDVDFSADEVRLADTQLSIHSLLKFPAKEIAKIVLLFKNALVDLTTKIFSIILPRNNCLFIITRKRTTRISLKNHN